VQSQLQLQIDLHPATATQEPPHPRTFSSLLQPLPPAPSPAACHGELRQRHRRLRPARQQGVAVAVAVAGRYSWYGNPRQHFVLSSLLKLQSFASWCCAAAASFLPARLGMQPAVLFGCCLKSSVLFFRQPPLTSVGIQFQHIRNTQSILCLDNWNHVFVYLMAHRVQLFSLPAHILDSYHHVVLFFLVLFYKFLLHH